MERNYRGKLWAILSAMAGVGLLVLLLWATQSEAQWPSWLPKRSTPQKVFTEGIELYRKAEYEKAKICFDNTWAHMKMLTPDQQRDLLTLVERNNYALVGRQNFETTLVRGETAFKQNLIYEANQCIKELDANQFGSGPQQTRLLALKCHVNGCTLNFKEIFQRAKDAFKNGDLEQAQWLAERARDLEPNLWTYIHPFSDRPGNLLAEIQKEYNRRAHLGTDNRPGGFNGPGTNPYDPPVPKINNFPSDRQQWPPPQSIPVPPPEPPGMVPPPQASDSRYAPGGLAVRMSNQDLPSPNNEGDIRQTSAVNVPEDDATAEKHRIGLVYMRDAENALRMGDLAEAVRKANMAKELRVTFRPSEPNPDRVLQEVYRRQLAAGGDTQANPADNKGPSTAKPQDAKALVRQARELMKKQQYEEAQRLIALASEARPRGWDWPLFGDSPEKLQRDLNRLRTDRDREKANQLTIQARKLFNGGDIDEAKKLAQEAKALHGPYSLMDWGERPQHLLDDIYRLELRQGTQQVAMKQDLKSDDPPSGPIPSAPDTAKRKQAEALISEARTLQSQGNLVEARTKLIEADALNVAFGPNEPSPRLLLAALGVECNKLLNLWCQQGDDLTMRSSDPDRFQKALALLNQARQLCLIFGQDPQPIDMRRNRVLQYQGQAPPPAPSFTAMQQQGLEMLKQARTEMDIGNLPVARKLIMEAFDKKYEIGNQAGWMLHTLEAMEHKQRIDSVNLDARTGIEAFQRKEYRRAAQILHNVNMNLLEPMIAGRVRDILLAPEMQPSNLARERSEPPNGGFAAERAPAADPGKPAPGTASISDMPQGRDLKMVRDLEKVQFGYWRDRSIGVQQRAIEMANVNPSEAITYLENFLNELRGTSFDPNDQAALIQPIEIRINHYKTALAQRMWEKQQQQAAREPSYSNDGKKQELERNEKIYATEQDVAKRVNDARDLMKQGKYEEALKQYEMCHQLLPEAMAPIIGAEAARTLMRERNWRENKRRNEQFNEKILDNHYVRAPVSFEQPMLYDPNFNKNRPDLSNGLPGVTRSPKERVIEDKLKEPITLTFSNTRLGDAIVALRAQTGLNIVPDSGVLAEAGINMNLPVSLPVEEISLKSALELLLRPLHLTYVIKNEVLQITTEGASHGNLVQRIYNITDLVVPIPNFPTSTWDNLHDAFQRHMAGSMAIMSNQASPMTANFGIPPGVPVSTNSGYPMRVGANPGQPAGFQAGDPAANRAMADQLISTIQDFACPHTWKFSGGQGDIGFFPLGNALIVNQTEDVHEAIASLLGNLRKMQEVQVAIEMRVLTLSDQFYDLVNMNFEIGNTSAFAKGPGMIAGIAPAGTAPNMNIPFSSVANAFATPPFAGILAGTGSIAIGAGFSFLNEIQVQMFMEAARGDKRTQQLANPVLTVLNGQTATIGENNIRFFSTNATPIQNGAQVFFMPQNNPFPVGINMQVTPIVSADRRFVRLHLIPNITNLVSNNIPAMPVEIPVPQIYDGRDGGVARTTLVKMWYQQPEFHNVSLNTTVNVPDGGTVLLGGLKTMAEVRVETGAPYLAQLPFFGRFFRNNNYTRETRSLVIMVTPRIIINEEEMIYYPPQQAPLPPTAMQR